MNDSAADWRYRFLWFLVPLCIGLLAFGVWLGNQYTGVQRRKNFASWLEYEHGQLIPFDKSDLTLPVARLSWSRRYFDDQPIRTVELPYGYPEHLQDDARRLFPEAQQIVFSEGKTSIFRLFGGEENLGPLRHPSRVEAARLKPNLHHSKTIEGYPDAGLAVEVSAVDYGDISKSLVDPESYRWGSLVNCIPDYGIRITWFDGDERIDVLICFECSLLMVFHGERFVEGAHFNSDLRDRLLAAAKKLFPNYTELQRLELRNADATQK